ncbi:MAG: monovalent cation/H+ antiporter subunit D family protein [Deltaproteobacteria bacterium]|nr:monovalent cation/H+ antiporter subunit D family protein [Deltaproteobacteria bacterium]
MSTDLAIILSFLLPTVAGLSTALTGRWPNARDSLTVLWGVLTFGTVLTLLPVVNAGGRPGLVLWEVLEGLPIAFEVEPLGMLFALVASGLWIVTSVYAFGYMRGHHEENQTRFFSYFPLAITAALGIAYARNLFTLFLFYEMLTFSTYPLVTHHQNATAQRAGRIYLGILVSTSVLFLFTAIVWTYAIAGTTEFTVGGVLAGKASGWPVAVLAGLYFFGIGKAALMPFHRWLPNAMVAPTPVSALLHAVAVVKAGVFSVLKIVIYIFGIDFLAAGSYSEWLMWVAGFTLLSSSVVALKQDNLKARLAYSTISQLAYIVLAAAIATGDSVVGGGMHIAMHAMAKITLFFAAGAIMVATHKTEISDMDGIGRTMPITMTAFFIASLSIMGLPPTGGAWSKWYLALGAAETGQYLFVAVYMISSLLSIAYLGPIIGRAFFRPPRADSHHPLPEGMKEAHWLMVVPLSLTAIGTVVLFFFANNVHDLLAPIAIGG